MGIDTALFDLDGTLINTEARSMAMWRMLLDRHEVEYDVRAFMGRRSRDVIPEVFPGADVEEIVREVFSYDEHPGLPEIAPVPGAADLVRAVAAYGSPIGLVTSSRRWWAEARLAEVGVRDLIRTVVSAEDVEVGKPDPAGFLLAAERLGASPADCVVFEDSLAGIAAAKAAGMRCVGVATNHADEELAGADLVVADLTAVDWPPFA
ncbi:HAD-IA family hydrolase [Nonomuraea sp. NN258]|uniref:HAD family hydrolase n=1 Tax=Nonomuraea antri TaxID=2730852 RepID=UPI0015697824|nr:HAD-IA family hydrolase [Nonomuraea antri]NRQ36163.1 HAD-IA family hydrolase [Nonomuraea antri]